tara:strand:+ start:114 stop:575 length:462 start_codon:yes stop_codon:yes gene_type:complete
MATVFSTQRTNARAVPSVKNKANELGGRVRIAHGVYEASALSAGDVIEMFILPDGARIITGSLAHDALGSSTTLAVGHGAYVNAAGTTVALDADEFKAAASSASAGKADVAATLALGSGIEIDANQDGYPVTVTLAGAAATGTIELTMLYALD